MISRQNDHRPKVIVIASPKGGCSKTTTVVGLTGAALERGYVLDVIDTDVAQHSLADWLEGHDRVRVDVQRPEAVASSIIGSSADLVLVDTAGSDTPMIGAVLVVSDLVLIPTADSLLEVGPAVRLHGRLRRQGKATRIVMSCVDRMDSLRVERARSLAMAASCLEGAIPRRVAVKDARAAHQLLSEHPQSGPVHKRFLGVFDEVLPILNGVAGQGAYNLEIRNSG